MTAPEILIVEDEQNLRELMVDMLCQIAAPIAVDSVAKAQARLQEHIPDLLLLDIKLPDGDGLQLLGALRAQGLTVPAIIITAFGTVERAAAAMRAGAADFLVKPFDNARFMDAVARALDAGGRMLEVELSAGALDPKAAGADPKIIGEGLQDIVAVLHRVASTNATVLITGESGTGKELIARAIHERSARMDEPLVSINCAAIAPSLLESELFGFERGAFTGAHAQRRGLIEAAHRGTLFLDEIGDLPLEAQSKLLRVLQERQIVRVGGQTTVSVDIRIIAATHRDLQAMVWEGTFRQDLLYRLNVVPIALPPLRERRDDVPGLVEHFLEKLCRQHKVRPPELSAQLRERLTSYDWPGNVRELQNLVERAVVLGAFDPRALEAAPVPEAEAPAPTSVPQSASEAPIKTLRQAVAQAEREAVVAALQRAGGNKAAAARLLGISYKTLFNKIHDHGIQSQVSIK